MRITYCPECKEYLAECDKYKYCVYCGWEYDITKLIVEEIEDDPPSEIIEKEIDSGTPIKKPIREL